MIGVEVVGICTTVEGEGMERVWCSYTNAVCVRLDMAVLGWLSAAATCVFQRHVEGFGCEMTLSTGNVFLALDYSFITVVAASHRANAILHLWMMYKACSVS